MSKTPRRHSQAGAVSLTAEKVGIQDTTIAGNCEFTGRVIIINGLDITGAVHFSGPVHIEEGGTVVINGKTWIPKGRA